MIFYLVRHGQTDWNKEGRLQGREDVPLNETGIREAHALGELLRGLRPEYILTSPLSRASQSAEILGSYIGGQIVVEEELTERDFGAHSGKIMKDIFSPGEDVPMEPLETVGARFLDVLRKYADAGSVVAVSHGGAINAVLRTLTNGKIGSGVTRLKNLCLCIVKLEEGKFSVEDYNLTGDDVKKWI